MVHANVSAFASTKDLLHFITSSHYFRLSGYIFSNGSRFFYSAFLPEHAAARLAVFFICKKAKKSEDDKCSAFPSTNITFSPLPFHSRKKSWWWYQCVSLVWSCDSEKVSKLWRNHADWRLLSLPGIQAEQS